MSLPVPQLLMMFLLVRKKRTCAVAWTNAGFTRRLTTAMWAAGFVQQNGAAGKRSKITSQDLVPMGLDKAERSDIEKLHAQMASWLDYWSARYPNDTLEQAMLNLLVRLWKMKDGWVKEKGDQQFPFADAMDGIVAGKIEQYVSGKV